MKRSLLILGVALMFALGVIVVGCGDSDDEGGSGPSPTVSASCESACSEENKCEDSDFNYDECVQSCKEFGDNVQGDFFEALFACVEEHNAYCNDALVQQCINENLGVCDEPSNLDSLIKTMCQRNIECNGGTPTEDNISSCVQTVRNMMETDSDIALLKCLTSSSVSNFDSCFKTTACEDLDNCSLSLGSEDQEEY